METQLVSETNEPVNTNPVDPKPQVGVTAANQHQPQTLKHATPVDDNGNENTSATPGHADFEQNPSTPKSQRATIGESKKTWVPPNGKYMTTTGDTGVYYGNAIAATQTKSPPEQDYGAYPPRQPGGRDTSDPETKLTTKHNSRRKCTAIGPHTVADGEEPHTNRDVNLIPDRGKEPNEMVTKKIKHEEPPPEFNSFCMYKWVVNSVSIPL